MFAAFSLTSNATYTVVVSPCEGVLNEVYHRELTYEEVKAAQERLIKKMRETQEQRWQPEPADKQGRECLDQSITDNAGQRHICHDMKSP